jgi:hypothetical protein
MYAMFPVAPPRLAGVGLVDHDHAGTGFAIDSKLTTSFYNQLAAVPSLHVGFAVAVGIAVAASLRNPVAQGPRLDVGPDDRPRRGRDRQPLRVRHRRRRARERRGLRRRHGGGPLQVGPPGLGPATALRPAFAEA